MILGLRRFHSLPCGFMRFNSTTRRCFGILLGFNFRLRSHLRDAIGWFITRRGWCHRSFQFPPRVFENFFVLFVIWIDEVSSSQSSSIVEPWVFLLPIPFFSILSAFSNFRPNFWPYMIWSGSRLNLCQSLPDHMCPCGGFSFNRVNMVNLLSKNLANVGLNRHSNNHQFVSLVTHPHLHE